MDWKPWLACIMGSVDQELLVHNEYLVPENCILRQQRRGHMRLSDGKRKTLAEIGKKLGRQALAEVATSVNAETILVQRASSEEIRRLSTTQGIKAPTSQYCISACAIW